MFRFISVVCFILGLSVSFGFGDQDLTVGQPNHNDNLLSQPAPQNDPFGFMEPKENLPQNEQNEIDPFSLFSSAMEKGQQEKLQVQPPYLQAQELQKDEKDPFDFSSNSARVGIKDDIQPAQPQTNEKDPFALLSSSYGVGVREQQEHGFQELPDQNKKIISNTNSHADIDNQNDPFGFLSSSSETNPKTVHKENGLQEENLFQKSESNVDIQPQQPQSQSRSDPSDPFSNLFAKSQSNSALAPALLGNEISKDLNPESNNQNAQPDVQAGITIEDRDDNPKSNQLHQPSVQHIRNDQGTEATLGNEVPHPVLDSLPLRQVEKKTNNQERQQQSDVTLTQGDAKSIQANIPQLDSQFASSLSASNGHNGILTSNQIERQSVKQIDERNGSSQLMKEIIRPHPLSNNQPDTNKLGPQITALQDTEAFGPRNPQNQQSTYVNVDKNILKQKSPETAFQTHNVDPNSLLKTGKDLVPKQTDAKLERLKDDSEQFNSKDVDTEVRVLKKFDDTLRTAAQSYALNSHQQLSPDDTNRKEIVRQPEDDELSNNALSVENQGIGEQRVLLNREETSSAKDSNGGQYTTLSDGKHIMKDNRDNDHSEEEEEEVDDYDEGGDANNDIDGDGKDDGNLLRSDGVVGNYNGKYPTNHVPVNYIESAQDIHQKDEDSSDYNYDDGDDDEDYGDDFNLDDKDLDDTNGNFDRSRSDKIGPGVDEDDVNNDFDEDGGFGDYLVTKEPQGENTTLNYSDSYSSDADINGPLGEDDEEEDWYHNPDRESVEDVDDDPYNDDDTGFDNIRDADDENVQLDGDDEGDVDVLDADDVEDSDETWSRFQSRDKDRENDFDTDDRGDHNEDQHYFGKFPGIDILDEVEDSKPPTAPTNMVLFYTWMILAILVMVIVVSTYQAKCKGFLSKENRQQTRGGGEDKKRLLDNEYV